MPRPNPKALRNTRFDLPPGTITLAWESLCFLMKPSTNQLRPALACLIFCRAPMKPAPLMPSGTATLWKSRKLLQEQLSQEESERSSKHPIQASYSSKASRRFHGKRLRASIPSKDYQDTHACL